MNDSKDVKALALNTDHHIRMTCMDLNNRADPEVQAEVERKDAESRAKILGYMKAAFDYYKVSAPLNLLDLGCGYARDAEVAKDTLSIQGKYSIQYTGVEIVPHVVDAARIRLPHYGLHCSRWEKAAEWWPGRFDFIYSRHVMEHCMDVDEAMTAIFALLAPGGVVGAITPHYFPDAEPAHVCQMTHGQWMEKYAKAGLDVTCCTVECHNCVEAHLVAKKAR